MHYQRKNENGVLVDFKDHKAAAKVEKYIGELIEERIHSPIVLTQYIDDFEYFDLQIGNCKLDIERVGTLALNDQVPKIFADGGIWAFKGIWWVAHKCLWRKWPKKLPILYVSHIMEYENKTPRFTLIKWKHIRASDCVRTPCKNQKAPDGKECRDSYALPWLTFKEFVDYGDIIVDDWNKLISFIKERM